MVLTNKNIKNLHQKLKTKYRLYHNWRQTKHHNKIHWGTLAVFTLLIFGTILYWTPTTFAAPTTPTTLTATPISSSQINLSWTASTDNVAVIGYRVERCQGSTCTNFAQISTPTATSYNDTGLVANTTYRYQVRAVDAAGNESGKSTEASATTLSFSSSDLNQDQKVNSLDFEILKLDWNQTTKPVSDINQDGIVNTQDLGIMMSEWGG